MDLHVQRWHNHKLHHHTAVYLVYHEHTYTSCMVIIVALNAQAECACVYTLCVHIAVKADEAPGTPTSAKYHVMNSPEEPLPWSCSSLYEDGFGQYVFARVGGFCAVVSRLQT